MDKRGDNMSQYKRMISYMYQYVAGEKGQNIGFVRIEQRGGSLRFILQMRTMELAVMPEVWLFRQNATGIEYMKAGKIGYRSGNLYLRIDTEYDNVCDSGNSFDSIDGVIVFLSEREYYATSWTNDSIYVGEMTEYVNKANKHEDKRNNIVEETDDKLEEKLEDKVENQEENNPKADLDNNSEEELRIEKIKIEEREDIRIAEVKEEEEAPKNDNFSVCDNCPYNDKNKDFGERILSTFPVMYPFVSGKIVKSVRIEPKDIGCLPVNKWAISNNRFLLHGYYCYRHLIFVKLKDGRYAIGVPGVYSDKADKTAKEYSFDEFQAIGTEKRCQGAFGYWLSVVL